MNIKHHNIFQVYIPKIKIDKNTDFKDIIMLETHLMYNGELTPDYVYDDKNRTYVDVLIWPSLIYLSINKYTNNFDRTQFINECIDTEFSKMLLIIKPIYRINEVLEYHFHKYNNDKKIFLKHIKYVILNGLEQIIESENKKKLNQDIKYNQIEEIINGWIKEKNEILKSDNMNHKRSNNTSISKVDNVIINNNSNIKAQNLSKPEKRKYQFISIIVSILMLLIAVVTNWKTIISFVH